MDDLKKTYRQLTTLGQARRLRRMALKSLEHYNLEVARLRLVTNDFNGIFRIDTTTGERYILRVALPEGGHTLESSRSEMEWLDALSRDTDLPVPRPLVTIDGELVVEVECDGVPETRLCMIFRWLPGTNLSEHLSEANVYKLGHLAAQLHAHAKTYQPPPGFSILRYDSLFPFLDPVILFDDEYTSLVPPERREVFKQALDWAQEALNQLQISGEPMRVIHSDLHQWNVRVYRGVLYPIDFEDLMWGWPVQDIANTLYYILDLENYLALRIAFQQGYTSHAPWPERYPGEIEAFIAARGLDLVNFILQDPNPGWRLQASAFIERTEIRLGRLLENNGPGVTIRA